MTLKTVNEIRLTLEVVNWINLECKHLEDREAAGASQVETDENVLSRNAVDRTF